MSCIVRSLGEFAAMQTVTVLGQTAPPHFDPRLDLVVVGHCMTPAFNLLVAGVDLPCCCEELNRRLETCIDEADSRRPQLLAWCAPLRSTSQACCEAD